MQVLYITAIHVFKCNGVALSARQLGNLVVVVTKACTHFPLPVFLVDDCCIHIYFYTLVGKLTLVGPVICLTGNVVQLLQGKQVICLVPEEVDSSLQAVVQEATLQGNVPLGCGFPLNTAIGNILQVETYSIMGNLLALPVCT